MPERDITFWKIFFNSVILTFPLIFVIRFLFSRASAGMIKDMRGDDGRWQFNEISQAASIVMSVVSWLVIISMIFFNWCARPKLPTGSMVNNDLHDCG